MSVNEKDVMRMKLNKGKGMAGVREVACGWGVSVVSEIE